MTKPCEWDHKTLWFTPFCFPPSFRLPPSPPLGWAGEGQHGEADILRPVSSWEARPYRSLPVWEIVKGCGPTQIRVSITSQSSFDILNNFFCAAHWVNRLEFRTNKIKMLISPWEEFVDMEANLSFLSKTKPTWRVGWSVVIFLYTLYLLDVPQKLFSFMTHDYDCDWFLQCTQPVQITFTLGRVQLKSAQCASLQSLSGRAYYILIFVAVSR